MRYLPSQPGHFLDTVTANVKPTDPKLFARSRLMPALHVFAGPEPRVLTQREAERVETDGVYTLQCGETLHRVRRFGPGKWILLDTDVPAAARHTFTLWAGRIKLAHAPWH